MLGVMDGDRQFIGIDGVAAPKWATADQKVVAASWWKTVHAVPGAVAAVVGLAWRASPRWTVVAGTLHMLSGCVTAFSLLATANVLTALLTQGPTPERVVAALPAIALVLSAYAARALLDAAVAMV